ncbi:MAG: hypothetical protein B6U94_04915 [Thermofilum sp. ex4484_79]|nr:MAG: hypothetical protein B6U94_04915 [Thermofilum sp. ex4484_79]HDD64435.1 hypothetical protein [Thermoprotei archaeon]
MKIPKCEYVKCDRKASIYVLLNNKQLAFCDEHYRKLISLLTKIALLKNAAELENVKVKREGKKVRFISKVKVPRKMPRISSRYIGLVREYMGTYTRK